MKKHAYVARSFMSLLFLFLLSSCSPPPLEQVAFDGKVLAFGDSLTVGLGSSAGNNYPAILSKLSGLEIINAGISGETTQEGVRRFPDELERSSPDLVILLEGGNDILRNHNHAQIKSNLTAMIEEAKRRQIPVVLIGVPQKNLFSDAAPFYAELAEQYQLVFDGELIGDLMRSPSLKSDPIHFNDKGYQKMAEAIYDLLKDNGALR